MTRLTPDLAARWARSTLDHVGREFPNKLDHVMDGPNDAATPRALHPIFYGSFDWHSCVHGWWQLLTIARLFPDLPEVAAIRARADAMLVTEKVAGELAYLARPSARGFSRPYGRAWLLALHGEAARHDAGWDAALELLARRIAEDFRDYLALLTYPIRVGAHPNTAFALIHMLGWAERHDPALVGLIRARALAWYGGDRDAPAWEPGGDEFLSAMLCEALLMLLAFPAEGPGWFDRFLPRATVGEPATLFTPATVSDRSDGKIAHLDGLNLSRAWCWRRIGEALGAGHPAQARMIAAADAHLAASLPHLFDHYMGEHWLASFALLALMGDLSPAQPISEL